MGKLANAANAPFASEPIMFTEIVEEARVNFEVARIEFERHWRSHPGARSAGTMTPDRLPPCTSARARSAKSAATCRRCLRLGHFRREPPSMKARFLRILAVISRRYDFVNSVALIAYKLLKIKLLIGPQSQRTVNAGCCAERVLSLFLISFRGLGQRPRFAYMP